VQAPVAVPLDAPAEAELALSDVFLGMRAYHLVSALLCVTLDRRRYRRPRLATAALAAVAVESVWLGWRHRLRRVPLDQVALTTDVLAGTASMIVCAVAALPDEQFTPVNWAFPMNVVTAVGASAGYQRPRAVAATSLLVGTYVTATASQTRRFHPEVMAGILQYVGGLVVGDVIIRRLRRTAAEIVELHTLSVDRATRIAEEETRAVLQLELHRRSIDTLRQVRDHLVDDNQTARAVAGQEAARLRRALRGESSLGLVASLERLAEEAAERGIAVELITSDLGLENDLPTEASDLLAATAGVVLARCDAAADGERALVRAAARLDGSVELSVRYRGPYRDDAAEPAGLDALRGKVSAAGGGIDLRQPANGGVRMTVTLPPPSDGVEEQDE
jgi:hypothetical protein